MITSFEDFCLWTYVVVDDLWRELGPYWHRPGPAPDCSDSELLTLALVGECRGWAVETELLQAWEPYRALFPRLPSQSRFNRRRRQLAEGFNLLRRVLLRLLDLAQDRQCAIDSLPVPVVRCHAAAHARGDWAAHGATYGRVPSKRQLIYGYKLHVLVTLSGVILDFALVPANVHDLVAGLDLLDGHRDLDAVGDKAYISAAAAADLWQRRGIRLLTVPRRPEHRELPPDWVRVLNAARQIVETVNGQLAEQFRSEVNHAHTFGGLCARLQTKLAAHTLCIYLNRVLGQPDWLQIKALAYPN
jgi:IS5 family transposase